MLGTGFALGPIGSVLLPLTQMPLSCTVSKSCSLPFGQMGLRTVSMVWDWGESVTQLLAWV